MIDRKKRSSIPYFVLRLLCIALGFRVGDFSDMKTNVLIPGCLSLCVTNIYMFVYLESAIASKSIEQCKMYCMLVFISCLETYAIMRVIMVQIDNQKHFLFSFKVYFLLCLVELVRAYFVCSELGDTFEWFYFKYGGARLELRSKFKKPNLRSIQNKSKICNHKTHCSFFGNTWCILANREVGLLFTDREMASHRNELCG